MAALSVWLKNLVRLETLERFVLASPSHVLLLIQNIADISYVLPWRQRLLGTTLVQRGLTLARRGVIGRAGFEGRGHSSI